jgi:hypothetical protein
MDADSSPPRAFSLKRSFGRDDFLALEHAVLWDSTLSLLQPISLDSLGVTPEQIDRERALAHSGLIRGVDPTFV